MEQQLEEVYQKIYQKMDKIIPVRWTEVFYRAEPNDVIGDSFGALCDEFYYVDAADKKKYRGLDIKNKYPELKDAFFRASVFDEIKEIGKIFHKNHHEMFKIMCLHIKEDRTFEVKFFYEYDEGETSRERMVLWNYRISDKKKILDKRLIARYYPEDFADSKVDGKPDNNSVGAPATSGWDAIASAFERIYPGQADPLHYGALIKWRFGGKDPLDGISVYDGGDYWHFVTFGLSELYEKQSENQEVSGYGMEFTLKLKKVNEKEDEAEIRGICNILQTIARITFQNNEVFKANEYVYTGQVKGMDVGQRSNITGFITVPEPKRAYLDTPNGRVELVEFVGATDAELKKIVNHEITVKELYAKLGTDVTSYHRKSCY